jgi:glycosyltransferase involved in cell wall biosynthesis
LAGRVISVVVPVYRNSENVAALIEALKELNAALGYDLEVVLVVDGSPDDSYARLTTALLSYEGKAQLLLLSRNFGSFAAIRAGLEAAKGDRFGVISADLQEPPELMLEFNQRLAKGTCDIVIGTRANRADPWLTRLGAGSFWAAYRRWVQPEVPRGGVDIFGCSKQVRDEILELREANSSLIGLLFWIGFRREYVPYERRARVAGKSAWTFAKKMRYLSDSIFNFTDLPVRLLFHIGLVGTLASMVAAIVVILAKITGRIPVPGYAATVLIVIFFGALNCLGLGIVGGYLWRTLENTRRRPNFLIAARTIYDGTQARDVRPSASDR